VDFSLPAPDELPQALAGCTIAVARDAAFSFLYQANLDALQAMGAELRFFSPLADSALPAADSLYLPGGYPELHLATLAANHGMKAAIHQHHQAGKPILAECGGMLYLLQSLADKDGASVEMAGLLSGHAAMQPHLTALALQQITLPEGDMRGHTYHHSKLTSDMQAIASGTCPNGGKTGEAVFRQGRLTASYIHLYFASNPQATAKLFLP
jgi:cobyrinic acid a,c-diamide synthase